jgi:hypothetical protein
MTDIEKLASNGFTLLERGDRITDIAVFSLRLALKAYFSTYQAMKYSLHIFDGTYEDHVVDFNHSLSYCEACAEAILHFQHFAELACKDILRKDHEMLAVDASKQPTILHKLLKSDPVTQDDMERLKSIEFAETLDRLCVLIKDKRLASSGQLDFIVAARPCLDKLNHLRNRLWHRGVFILHYNALDEFVGSLVLPFVLNITALPAFSGVENLWKYRKPQCGVDPIEGIIAEVRSNRFDLGKVALLKEIGRAAYRSPLHPDKGGLLDFLNQEHQHHAERIAKAERNAEGVADVRQCPVCGVESLIVYENIELEGRRPEDGSYEEAWRYTYRVECMCCTFEINHHLKNPSQYGLPIGDYWHAESA